MNPDNPLKQFAAVFAAALAIYALSFVWIEHRRNSRGPWEIVFTSTPAGHPTLVILQPALSITNARITFPDETFSFTNGPVALRIDTPREPPVVVPFGKIKYMDLTFLPGVVTLELFGHEIELLPRTLYVNRKEIAWSPALEVTAQSSEKLPPEALAPPAKKKR